MTALPLPGSVLSVYTKNELRYEGTLADLDHVASTILLINVRALGTEGKLRQGGLPAIAASTKIFPSIIFKGSEISEIKVLVAAPPLVPVVSSPLDPAPPPPLQPTPPQPVPPATAPPRLARPDPAPTPSKIPSLVNRSVFDKQLGNAKSMAVVTVSGLLPSDTQADMSSLLTPEQTAALTAVKMQGKTCDLIFNDSAVAADVCEALSHPRFSFELMKPPRQPQPLLPRQSQPQRNSVPRVQARHPKTPVEPLSMNMFDFESANAKFQKEPAPISFAPPEKPTPRGFFDTISNSVSEKSVPGPTYRDHRQKNLDTFGAMARGPQPHNFTASTGQPLQDAARAANGSRSQRARRGPNRSNFAPSAAKPADVS